MTVSPARPDAFTKSLQSSLKLREAQPSFARLITTSWIGLIVLPWKERDPQRVSGLVNHHQPAGPDSGMPASQWAALLHPCRP